MSAAYGHSDDKIPGEEVAVTAVVSDLQKTLAEPDEIDLGRLDAWWRAANYLTIGQIYLQGNPLLREPLDPAHIKPRLLGHWGTSPGLSFIYAHVSRLIRHTGQQAIYLAGPGHGGPALVAAGYLEGTYTEIYPTVSQDEGGMLRLFRQFSSPGGIPSHVSVTTPGSIHEGGELGYVLVHAFGAVMDNPDLLAIAVVGDGEAETGPLEGSWKGISFLNPARDGAVLPILHLNDAKISGPTVLGRKHADEVQELLRGHGYDVIEVSGDDLPGMHVRFAAALAQAWGRIRAIQNAARDGSWDGTRPIWPLIVLRSPKGWTGPAKVDGVQVTGSWRSHQVPLSGVRDNPAHLAMLEAWLRSYRPEELFDDAGVPVELIRGQAPDGDLRMSASPHANGGLLTRDLDIPDFREYAVKVAAPGAERAESTRKLGELMRDIYTRNPRDFRLFCPDETNSNRLGAVFEASDRAFMEHVTPDDVAISRDGRVVEVLSEHNCHGWLEGYNLTGRHGLFATYEAFAMVSASQTVQHGKWLQESKNLPWRAKVPSLNVLLTSTAWRNDHNGFSHQGPGLIQVVLNQRGDVARVYLPPDANCLLSVADHCFRSRSYVNLIVIDKQPQLQYLTHGRGDRALRPRRRHLGVGRHRRRQQRPGHRAGLRRRHRHHGDGRGRADPAGPAARLQGPGGQRGRPDDADPAQGPPARHERDPLHRAVHRHRRRGLRVPRLPGRDPPARARAAGRRPVPGARLHRGGHHDHPVRHDGPQPGVPLPPGDGRDQQRQAAAARRGRPEGLVRVAAGPARDVRGGAPGGHARGSGLVSR